MSAVITKNIRVRLTEAEWTDIRVMAAHYDESVTSLINSLVREPLARNKIKIEEGQ
jgi:hypothetical protein